MIHQRAQEGSGMQDDNNKPRAASAEAFTLEDWVNGRPEFYNLSAEFEQQVVPLIDKAKEALEALGIPFIFFAVIEQNATGSQNLVTSSIGGTTRATAGLLGALECAKDNLENVQVVSFAAGRRYDNNRDILVCQCEACKAEAAGKIPSAKTIH
jgi:hypothetical protein